MKAAIYYGPKNIKVEERPMPVAGKGDVVVKNMRAGICGTDLTAYLYDGKYVAIFPGNEFGHEMVSVITQVGPDVTDFKVGDRVFVNPATCKREGMFRADTAGAFSEYVLVEDARRDYNLFHLADSTTFDEAVVTEPFSVGAHGKNIPGAKPGDHVVVYGAGTIGLCALSSLVGMGVKDVVVIDINDQRLKVAEKLGGTGLNPQHTDTKEFLTKHFGATANHLGMPTADVDIFIDCAGVPTIPNEFLGLAKAGAKLSVVAVYKQAVSINMSSVMSSEGLIMGSCAYTTQDIKECIGYLDAKSTQVPQIVTHHFPLEKISEAFETAANPATGAIKVVIDYE